MRHSNRTRLALGSIDGKLIGSLGLVVLAGVAVAVWTLRSHRVAAEPTLAEEAAGAVGPSSAGPLDVFKERLRRSPQRESGAPHSAARLLQRIAEGDSDYARLTGPEIDLFLASSRTNAESLLVAHAMSKDSRYLKLAAEMYPDHPMVALQMVTAAEDAAERFEWMKRFRATDPDNSLPDYLMAREYLQSGDRESAWDALAEAANKEGFHDYLRERIQSAEEAYLLSGRSASEAKVLASFGLEMPYLPQLRSCANEMAEAEQHFREAGDLESAARLAARAVELGQRFQNGSSATSLINLLVGMAIESDALNRWRDSSQPGWDSVIVTERLAELEQREAQLKSDARMFTDWMTQAPEPEVMAYLERMKLYGEPAALEWLRNRERVP